MTTRETFGEIADYPPLVGEQVDALLARVQATGEVALVDTVHPPIEVPAVSIPDMEKPLDVCSWWEKRVLNDGEHHSQTEVWQAATRLMSTVAVNDLMDKDLSAATTDLVTAATVHIKDILADEVDNETFVLLVDTLRNIKAISHTFGAQFYRLKRDLEAPKKGMLSAIREFMPKRQPVAAQQEIWDAAKKKNKIRDDIESIDSQLALHPAAAQHLEAMLDTGDIPGCLSFINECKSYWIAWEPYKTADTEIAGAFRVLESAYFVEPFGQISLRWNEALGAEIERLVAEIDALDDTERQQRINREDVEQTQLDREQKRQEVVNLFFMKRMFVPPPDRVPKERSLTYSDDAGDYTVGPSIDNIREGRRRPAIYDSDKAALKTIVTSTKALLKITSGLTAKGADTSFGESTIKGDLILPPEAIQKIQSMVPGMYFDKTRR